MAKKYIIPKQNFKDWKNKSLQPKDKFLISFHKILMNNLEKKKKR